jgi:hypothetical protein
MRKTSEEFNSDIVIENICYWSDPDQIPLNTE